MNTRQHKMKYVAHDDKERSITTRATPVCDTVTTVVCVCVCHNAEKQFIC